MPMQSTPRLIVLFDDELRDAARRVHAAAQLRRSADVDDDAASQAIVDALHACIVALDGAEDDGAVLVLATKAAMGVT